MFSMLILPPTVFYLMWLMALEFLMCVIAWFVGVTLQLFITFTYLVRRRCEHGSLWLTRTAEDSDTTGADMVGDALDSLNGRIKVSRDALNLGGDSDEATGKPRRRREGRDSSPGSRRSSSPDAARRLSGSRPWGSGESPREGMGTRLRDALEERMGELRQSAEHVAEARREARGEVALEPENDPATWPDARLASYLRSTAPYGPAC